MPLPQPLKRFKDESGLALLMTVATVALLTIFIVQFDALTRITAQETAHFRDGLKATYLAKAGTSSAQAVLVADAKRDKEVDGLQDQWAQQISDVPLRDGFLSISISDERGKFNLNNFSRSDDPNKLKEHVRQLRLLCQRLQINPNIVDSIVDWIDVDDDKRPFGAESAFYQSLSEPYWPKNGRVQNFLDLYLIKGMTDEIVDKLRPYVTIYPMTADGRININTASSWVLESLHPQMTPALAGRIIRARPFRNLVDVDRVSGMSEIAKELRLRNRYQVHSQWYSIYSEGRVNESVKTARAVVKRQTGKSVQLVMFRVD